MKEIDKMDFFDVCIIYRLVSLGISTLAYLGLSLYFDNSGLKKWLIIVGMCISCILSNYLYAKVRGQRNWIYVILFIELFAYGVFIILSGGFSSPYFWFYICCLLITMIEEENHNAIFLAGVWGVLCSILSRGTEPKLHLEINLFLGMLIAVGSFFVIKRHSGLLKSRNSELAALNEELKHENERSEYAMFQLAAIYRSFDLLIINDKDKIVRNLARFLNRTIAINGCILLKTDMEGNIENIADYGMESAQVNDLLDAVLKRGIGEIIKEKQTLIQSGSKEFELLCLDREVPLCGMIIRGVQEKKHYNSYHDRCYRKLAEIVLHNMDTRKQLEEYISSEEKNRIANEIHDTIIQRLFGIVCSMKEMENHISVWDKRQLKERTRMLEHSIQLAMSELRETIYTKRFEDESKSSLIAKVRLYIEEMINLHHVDIRSDIAEEVEVLSPTQKIVIYRAICEAVSNAIRHGKADKIGIDLVMNEKNISLSISNNGFGFEGGEAREGRGLGIGNIRKMAALLKGKMWIESSDKQEVLVYLQLPRSI